MNENKKKFNIIDVVLILALLAVVVGVAIRSGFADKFTEKLDEGHIEYEFIINSIKATSAERFEVGTKMYSQSTQKEVGEILNVTTRSAEAYIELPTGEIVKTIIPDRIDVIGTARVKGNADSEGRCMLDGTNHIAAGKNIYARTNDISFMFTVENASFVPDAPEGDEVADEPREEAPVQQEIMPGDNVNDANEAQTEPSENTAPDAEMPQETEQPLPEQPVTE